MTSETTHQLRWAKQQLRIEASARRASQQDGELLSRRIFERLVELPAYGRASTLMIYLDIRSEVRTRWFVPTAWSEGKRVVVPYCEDSEIKLFRLDSFDELAPGAMGVPEPLPRLRSDVDRSVDPSELDVIVAPGLAFDYCGSRLGYGRGYYDRLLCRTRPDALKAAVCFECQLFPEVPSRPHDIRMDVVITENAVYRADGQHVVDRP